MKPICDFYKNSLHKRGKKHEKGRNDMPANKCHIHLITICILYSTHLAIGSSLSQVTLYHLGDRNSFQLKLEYINY